MIAGGLRLIMWAILFAPWGGLAALISPLPGFDPSQRFLIGGCFSSLLLLMVIAVLFVVPFRREKKYPDSVRHIFVRPYLSFGTVSAFFGAVLPVIIILSVGDSLWPWSYLIAGAAFAAFITVTVCEVLTAVKVTINDDGFLVERFLSRQAVLFSMLVSGSGTCNVAPLCTKTGDYLFLSGYLCRVRKNTKLGHVLFAPFLNCGGRRSLMKRHHRNTMIDYTDCDRVLIMRYLSLKSRGLSGKYSPFVSFFLEAAGSKPLLSDSGLLMTLVPVCFYPFSFIAMILSCRSMNFCHSPAGCGAGFDWLLLTLFAGSVLSVLTLFYVLIFERSRMFIFYKAAPADNLWHEKSISFLKWARFISVLLLAVFLVFHCRIYTFIHHLLLSSGGLPHFGNLSFVLIIGTLPLIAAAFIRLFFLSSEDDVNRALADGSPDLALRLMRKRITSADSRFLAARRAYALAVSGAKLNLARRLAVREMCRLVAKDTMLYATVAAARIAQLEGDVDGAGAIGRLILLRFPELASEKGMRLRIASEAGMLFSQQISENTDVVDSSQHFGNNISDAVESDFTDVVEADGVIEADDTLEAEGAIEAEES